MADNTYELGRSRGFDAANFAVAYENAIRYAEPPELTDDDRAADTRLAEDRAWWDFQRGHDDGWNNFMEEHYPE
jgi:hypothetical protein